MGKLRYELDSLGWLEFEHLVQALLKDRLGMGVEAWGGTGDWGRDAYFVGKLKYPSRSWTSGAFVFQCKFVDAANAAGADADPLIFKAVKSECQRVAERLKPRTRLLSQRPPKWPSQPENYSLLTNAPLGANARSQIVGLLKGVLPNSLIHIHDGSDICSWLDGSGTVARRFPQLLGLRDLEVLLREYLHRDVSERSFTALAKSREVAKVFVPTGAYNKALEILSKHHFVVLEGPPEMGKSAIGRMIALAYAARGWEAIEIQHPEDFLNFRQSGEKQIFVADDFFGRTEYQPERISRWEEELPYILPRLDKDHWLVLTSRAHLLNIAKKNLDIAGGNSIFPQLGEVVVDAGELSVLEKGRILYRHSKQAGFTKETVAAIKSSANRVVHSEHFTPERIRRLASEVLPALSKLDKAKVSKAISESLLNPTKGMSVSFSKLPKSHQWLLYALVEQDQNTGFWDSTEENLAQRYGRLCPDIDREPFSAVLSEMTEAFVKRRSWGETEVVDWIHPSCRDLAIDRLGDDVLARRRFLHACDLDGIRLALSLGGGSTGKRVLPASASQRQQQ